MSMRSLPHCGHQVLHGGLGSRCVPCENGTYMDKPNGELKCLLCSVCHSGRGLTQLQPCTSKANTICGARSGFFCQNFRESSASCEVAQKHSSCSPGQRVQKPGTSSSDTECEDCPEGYFSPAGFNCTAWTVCPEAHLEVRPGTKQEDVVCGGGGAGSRSHFI
ncbi:hypothetical protein WMY93_027057 [Mugilogobius chulae]|uniref:TNFR-Cys domain-containing protein n=1 Tax=Mugilogobius chulae TaxID=88201 RepID=A0AAW0MYM8_9GOBI